MKKLLIVAMLVFFSVTSAFAGMQDDRLALINDLMNKGIFYKISKRSKFPHLYVKPRFYSLNFDDKQSFVSVVYAYYLTKDPKATMVVLFDSRTNKKIGVFSKVDRGLKLY